MKKFWAIITILTMFWGIDFSGKVLKVEEVWARAAPAGGSTAVFLIVNNKTSEGDTLEVVSSKAADSASIQEVSTETGTEVPHEIKKLAIAANEKKILKPHVMYIQLTGLTRALVPGDSIPINLTFTKAGLIETTAHVEASNATVYDNF